jgi:hypothetical protein
VLATGSHRIKHRPQQIEATMANKKESQVNSDSISRRLFLASTASVVMSAAIVPNAMAQTTPRVLKFSDHEPLGGMRTRFLKDVLFPAIEQESGGRLKIEDHWNGEIAAAYDALGAVGKEATAIWRPSFPNTQPNNCHSIRSSRAFQKDPPATNRSNSSGGYLPMSQLSGLNSRTIISFRSSSARAIRSPSSARRRWPISTK